MTRKTIVTAITAVVFSPLLFAQDTVAISKEKLLEFGLEKNLQLKIAKEQYKSAQADYRQSNALFLPNITASHKAITTTNPLMAFGSKLNQEILTQADFNPALLNNPEHTENFATLFEIQQPLINLDGLFERKAAKAKMAAMSLQTERTGEYIQLEMAKAYMQLQLAYKAVAVLEKANTAAQGNLKMVENYFKNGMLQKTDVLDVQVRVNEVAHQLQYAKSNVQNASDYLALLLNADMQDKVYKPFDSLEENVALEASPVTVSENRKDIQAMQKATEAYKQMFQSARMGFLPRLNAFGNYQLYDDTLFGTSANGYLIGAQLSWNIFDGSKNIGKTQKAKAEYHKAQAEAEQYVKQSQLELNKTNRQLRDAENKVQRTQLAFEQAKESYRIRKNRFEQGLEKTTDLLMSETQQSKKELEYLQAVFEYNFTKQYIQFLTQ